MLHVGRFTNAFMLTKSAVGLVTESCRLTWLLRLRTSFCCCETNKLWAFLAVAVKLELCCDDDKSG